MKSIYLLPALFISAGCFAQKVDSIYFNLYTDSLKKGTHNYINVVGRLAGGGYRPLSSKQLSLWSDTGAWEGNDLIIDPSFTGKNVHIKATLKNNASLTDSAVIWIKTFIDTTGLKTEKEILNKKKH